MFSVIFGILSAVCLIYFGIIAVYSGARTSAAWVWLVMAAVFLVFSRGAVFYHQHKKQIPLWLPVSAVTMFGAGVVVLAILQVLIFGGMLQTAPEHLDYLIVLGAKVREDDISVSLKRRLDKAIRFAQEHPETKLVLSGGQGADEPTTEAQAMAEYLVYNGVAPEQLLLEMVSTNTKENMICSKVVIDEQRRQEKERIRDAKIRKNKQRLELSRFLMGMEERYERERQREAFLNGKEETHTAMIEKDYNHANEVRKQRVSRVVESLAREARKTQRSYGPGMEAYQDADGSYYVSPTGEILPDKPLQIGVLTSNFHLYRAMKIGEKCGFEHLYGVASSSDPVLFVHLCVREGIAILKDKFMGNL